MKIDTHVHTIYSRHRIWGTDALNTPTDMVKAAIKKGLGGIAVTDHGTVRGSLVAKRYAKEYKNFIVITGEEVRTAAGDLLALGIKDDVPEHRSVAETVERVHALGGIAVAAHPFASHLIGKCLKEQAVEADAIEVFNSLHGMRYNKKAFAFAQRNGKPQTAGSDAHMIRCVGNAGIICSSDPIEEILRRKVKIFGTVTPYRDIAYLTIKKFSRSLKWRLYGKKL